MDRGSDVVAVPATVTPAAPQALLLRRGVAVAIGVLVQPHRLGRADGGVRVVAILAHRDPVAVAIVGAAVGAAAQTRRAGQDQGPRHRAGVGAGRPHPAATAAS